MRQWRSALRLYRILRVLVRQQLDELLPQRLPGLRLARLLVRRRPEVSALSRGARLRLALEELGPIFVKFGQILSTRRDLMPPDIADELALLQDRVAPFPGAQARAQIEQALGQPIEALYASFDEKPLASASISQVHPATLADGREVVIKVLRPGIHQRIDDDLGLLRSFASMAEKLLPQRDRIRPSAIVAEIERTLVDELDLMREGANGSLLRRNFAGSTELYVPEMIWPLSRETVLTMERVHGIPLGDMAALRAANIDFEKLARRAVELFYQQVFRDNFFHADLHPGNILIDAADPADPRFIALDFGIMGALPLADQRYLAENFKALFEQNYRRIADLHLEAGWIPANVRSDELEGAVRAVCEPYFTRPLSEISLGEVLMKLFQVAHRYQLIIQPQLILLQKTLLNVEGLARTLWPKLDLWAVAKPVLEQVMADRYGWSAVGREIRARLPGWVIQAPELPRLLHDHLRQAVEGKSRVQLESASLEKLVRATRQGQRSIALAVLSAATLLAAALLSTLEPGQAPQLFGLPIAPLLGGVALALGLLALRPK
ncbi:MAG: ubiquinone biosynthesis regulatory protein kinase UbiB [Xanthomonadales bacterium]|nr:ubiquinone biosynthesis regulatory protein kinase UbiB [Xanthomonadales bacterium]